MTQRLSPANIPLVFNGMDSSAYEFRWLKQSKDKMQISDQGNSASSSKARKNESFFETFTVVTEYYSE